MRGKTQLTRRAPGRSGSAFWRYSLSAWRDPGVAHACLALQDGCGADVNLLLYCCWMGRRGRVLKRLELQSALAAAGRWQEEVVRPLRRARRAIGKGDRGLRHLRTRIAAAELDAERIEQRLLGELGSRLRRAAQIVPPRLAVAANLAGYLRRLKCRGTARAARQVATLVAVAEVRG